MYKKTTMALVIATILTAYISVLTMSNQAFAMKATVALEATLGETVGHGSVIFAGSQQAGKVLAGHEAQLGQILAGHLGDPNAKITSSHSGLGCNFGDPHC